MTEEGEAPPDDPNSYVPSARPGARAPHVWLADAVALYDRFGRDFTLLKLDAATDTRGLEEAAQALQVPLKVVVIDSEEVRDLYESDLILIRPDQHVAWRGKRIPPDARALMQTIAG